MVVARRQGVADDQTLDILQAPLRPRPVPDPSAIEPQLQEKALAVVTENPHSDLALLSGSLGSEPNRFWLEFLR
jgi:hypothetical protein